MSAVSVESLSSAMADTGPLVVIDVRRQGARGASGQTIKNSLWRDPACWLDWKDEVAALPGPLVFFCVHGHEISQGLTAALRAMGKDARYLEGGFAQWQKSGLPEERLSSGA